MKQKNRSLVVLLGLALVAIGAGCGRSVVSRTQESNWVVPPPATSISVTLNAPTGGGAADIQGTRVVLISGGSILRDTTLASVTTAPFKFAFGNLAGVGTYQVAIVKTGYTLQVTTASITGSAEPQVVFTLRKLENSNTISVASSLVTSAGTTVTIPQPPVVTGTYSTAAPAQVTLPASSGISSVSVALQTASEVPTISTTQSVVSAVQIQTDATTTGAVTVKFPLPLNSSEFAAAAGGTVDVLRLNPTTMTWVKIGVATIGADGTATYNVPGLTSTNTVLCIGKTPSLSTAVQTVSTTTLLTPDQVANLVMSGTTTTTVPLNVSLALGKAARGGEVGDAAIDPPAGMDPAYWQMVLGVLMARLPELENYFKNGTQQVDYPLPNEQATLQKDRRSYTFNFTYTWNT
ncbi:MAG TPA: hypothetical protein PKN69_09720, partial [Candidatus Latescibacteria bacterium]|nr:hypothetical protein [Candidatus Latescibacterota bacterium]